MVRRDSCPREKQDGVQVRRKEMAELLPACADFPSGVGDESLTGMVRWATRQMANGIGSLRIMKKF